MNKKRALISVSNKEGVVEFAKALTVQGYEIISTGGTAKELAKNGVKIIGISDITNFPECLDGRVKTLHPAVHAGLLALRDNSEHMARIEELGINTIDVVAVNLYPFKETIIKPNITLTEAIENIDIGGPTMLRSAAKNYKGVIVACEPSDYQEIIDRLQNKTDNEEFRLKLMYKVFAHTAVYDSLISNYLAKVVGIEYPDQITLAFNKSGNLRYGENPHQNAGCYTEVIMPKGALIASKQLHGKELSFNNINDTNGAVELLREFDMPAVVAVKHAVPCGVGIGEDIYSAYMKAYECDTVSIFGGIVAFNREVDERTASEMNKIFLEVIIAPSFSEGAIKILTQKPNIRLLEHNNIIDMDDSKSKDIRGIFGGLLIQDRDKLLYDERNIKCVTKAQPSKEQMLQMIFALKVVKHVRSNAIVIANDYAAVGIGGGQPNRVGAARHAVEQALSRAKGGVAASDAYFPFADTAEVLIGAGVTAIIQPGGSIRDQESIDLCDRHEIPMIFTGQRHFKH